MFVQANGSASRARAIEYDAGTALSRLARHGGPGSYVIGQLGQSLDGRIATPTGQSKYINGTEALCHLHRIRALCDGVVIGVGTAVADDPMLTTRHVEGPSPVRVVIDPNGRLPDGLRMLSDGQGQIVVVTRPGVRALAGTRQIVVEDQGGLLPPARIVAALAAIGLRRLLVEGGAETLARFIDAGQMDELHIMVAPIVIGSGKTGLNLNPIDALDDALRPTVRTMRFRDGDMLCMCDMGVSEVALTG